GNLERYPGLQATGVAQRGEDADLDGRAAGDDVYRHQRDGLLLPRASARERDGHLTVRAHNFYRPYGLVLLRNPGHHRADSDPGREHFFRRLSAIVQPAGARSVHAAAVCDPW